ncbi:hypothetical protein [Streptomyces sp. NPDC020965]|uniref:hypothetical protein n=1 Tax=Streptomyces sp. NPDC020965 TaxID=3365105 RepID=UPI0037AB5AF5
MDIRLGKEAGSQVALLAKAWGVDGEEVILRLLRHFQGEGGTGAPEARPEVAPGLVPVHVRYAGQRIAGMYDPGAESLTISSGPAQGHYKSPSGAATAVLQALRPGVAPHRNGWSFWVVDETGNRLQTLRDKRTTGL